MEKVKELVERYMMIQASYDAFQNYTKECALKDLRSILFDIKGIRRELRAPWLRFTLCMLEATIYEEIERVKKI